MAKQKQVFPEDIGSKEVRKKRANDRFNALKVQETKLLEDILACITTFDVSLDTPPPEIPVPATREQLTDAVKSLIKEHSQLVVSISPKRADLKSRWDKFQETASAIKATYLRMRKDGLNIGLYGGRNLNYLEIKDNHLEVYQEAQGSRDGLLLQLQVEQMLEGQDDDSKNFILVETNPFSQHLSKCQKRPRVVLQKSRQLKFSNSNLPLEIMTMIYSYSSLESCISLRKVNTSWYSAFEYSERLFESKVTQRFPWMCPENDMDTWGACALVYVARKKSKKWIPVNNLNTMYTQRKLLPLKQLVATELKENEKLPEGFEGLNDAVLKTPDGELDFHTLNFSIHNDGTCKVVKEDETETVVKYKSKETPILLTLPPGVKPRRKEQYERVPPVAVHKQHIIVQCENRVFTFPRNKPLHYKNAFDQQFYTARRTFEVGHIHAWESYRDSLNHNLSAYEFFDSHTVQMREYTAATSAVPVASYSGLVWWAIKGRLLIPTFIDLEEPEKVFYRKDKIIGVSDQPERLREAFQQCKNPRFVTRKCEQGVLVIDLENETSTNVLDPHYPLDMPTRSYYRDTKNPPPRVIPGFIGGKFCAKYVDNEVVSKYEKEHAVPRTTEYRPY